MYFKGYYQFFIYITCQVILNPMTVFYNFILFLKFSEFNPIIYHFVL